MHGSPLSAATGSIWFIRWQRNTNDKTEHNTAGAGAIVAAPLWHYRDLDVCFADRFWKLMCRRSVEQSPEIKSQRRRGCNLQTLASNGVHARRSSRDKSAFAYVRALDKMLLSLANSSLCFENSWKTGNFLYCEMDSHTRRVQWHCESSFAIESCYLRVSLSVL